MVRKITECLGTKGHWTLPRTLIPKHKTKVLSRVTMKYSEKSAVQWASMVNNQPEGSRMLKILAQVDTQMPAVGTNQIRLPRHSAK